MSTVNLQNGYINIFKFSLTLLLVLYHINCINTWYKVSKKKECIICKKKDTTDLYKLENIFNKGYEILIHMILILFIIFYIISVVYYSFF